MYVPCPICATDKTDELSSLPPPPTMASARAGVRTLSIFSKESARRRVQPSMASPTTAESQAGQPAATCSPRALLAKLPPSPRPTASAAADRDDHACLSLLACFGGFFSSSSSAAFLATAGGFSGATGGGLGCWGWSREGAEGRPRTQLM
ncbi:Os10g0523000 [Oryza sativa Japonica Group]|uniref:Os10g0523000 protein n=2 Tax=Oryza sativa subsp. japonica TaxID=39947 RepID=Q0IWA0_ORYSJ|nr:Os10g0523000 [Oryza sativa Japonica Group]BAT11725.1 Os10g0523000 [Oryza sativa Japonica Group]|eukprot:NP_001065101.1 Os10g0523000 [Oryza sativa Japonica Group]